MARTGTDAPPSAAAPRSRRRWAIGGVLSAAVHLALALAFLAAQPQTRETAEPPPVLLALAPTPAPAAPDPASAPAAAAKAAPQPRPPRPTSPHPAPAPPRADRPDALPIADQGDEEAPTPAPTEAEIASAMTVGAGAEQGSGSGSGRGGGPCDMGARVQAALRGDPLVRASAVSGGAPGSATWVWNGDWVRQGGQDGKGLAAVREAILWEVGFAPPECRSAPVRGLVLITLDGAAGARRLVLGARAWRWSDLLHPRRDPRLEAEAAGLRPAALGARRARGATGPIRVEAP